jgi:hypothetical protein
MPGPPWKSAQSGFPRRARHFRILMHLKAPNDACAIHATHPTPGKCSAPTSLRSGFPLRGAFFKEGAQPFLAFFADTDRGKALGYHAKVLIRRTGHQLGQ